MAVKKERESSTWRRAIKHRKGKIHTIKLRGGKLVPIYRYKVSEKAAAR